ncbi:MAG: magnesium chelatase subunit H [Pseudomonadota bacterium]
MVAIITLDSHLEGTVSRAEALLREEIPGARVSLHAAVDWARDPEALPACKLAIAQANIIIVTMLFIDDQIQKILPDLWARRDECDAIMCAVSAGEMIKLTRMGRFSMDKEATGPIAMLKRLRGSKKKGQSSGAGQMAMLRRLPKILKYIPGTAQDVRAYFLCMQYWLAGSSDNVANLIKVMIDRYAEGDRAKWRGTLKIDPPREVVDVGLYHPKIKGLFSENLADLPTSKAANARVGILLMRSYVLAQDCAHYDSVIAALEARGIDVVPAFATGLDAREAIDKFFLDGNKSRVDAVVSLTGFSLVGGPAYNDAHAAEAILAKLDVPYVAAHAVEFQSLDDWRTSEQGLTPFEATMMVAIPELDGATGPMVFGGRAMGADGTRDMRPDDERVDMLAARVAKLAALKRGARDERKLAIVLFNFPPNAGSTGTAANLAVWQSLFNTLTSLSENGYRVELPENADALRETVLGGNAKTYGVDANVHALISADDHVAREPWLEEIEAVWGPAPGRDLTDGRSIFVMGAEFGNVFVTVQPSFGYEGDPMRLMFENNMAPTHAFSAYYRYLREDYAADVVLHFGTHGALEFMPGKQCGMTNACWPDRLIGDLPNMYLYAANNPSEGMIAKRRSAATLVSYLTPSVTEAGLYAGLSDLKASIERWRGRDGEHHQSEADLVELIKSQAELLDLVEPNTEWPDPEAAILTLSNDMREWETSLIPQGLHVLGDAPDREGRIELLRAMGDAMQADATSTEGGVPDTEAEMTPVNADAIARLVDGAPKIDVEKNGSVDPRLAELFDINKALLDNQELSSLVHALDGGFVPPAPGGDLIRAPEILPTGRNVHGFDPFRLPSVFAMRDGAAQAALLIERHREQTGDASAWPRSVAMVLWGTDNLKSEGGPIAQVLSLLGAKPRFDSYGRLCGAVLVPLEELGRPRIDVLVTLSGIFRDLLPLQTKVLAESCYLAAMADEDPAQNYVRAHALDYAEKHGCDLEAASLRVFSNADGAYGSNVNLLLDSGRWDDESELGETFTKRKCFAYGRSGEPAHQEALFQSMLADVDLAYQNLDSVELGVTTIDHYFDTLGGISRAVKSARGDQVPVYIGDQTTGKGKVRTLDEQVALETRTRVLNPKWYERMLDHGYEGVRQIEASVTNTLGWSATTGQVAPWVYKHITDTFVLDEKMRERIAELNPAASAKMANRLIEAHERSYWTTDDETLENLRRAGDELEDRLEGVGVGAVA